MFKLEHVRCVEFKIVNNIQYFLRARLVSRAVATTLVNLNIALYWMEVSLLFVNDLSNIRVSYSDLSDEFEL